MVNEQTLQAIEKSTPATVPGTGSALLNAKGVDTITVITMPKRFYTNEPKAKEAKSTGLLIMIGGGLLLVAAAAILYLFVIKKDPEPVREDTAMAEETAPVAPPVEPAVTTPLAETNAAAAVPTSTVPAVAVEEPAAASATTTAEATTTRRIVASEIPPVPAAAIVPGADGDGDGLSDLEEIILDTNAMARDSDADGYEDTAELENLYNPAGGGVIQANPNIKKYANTRYTYSLYYPSIWPIKNVGGDESILFTLDNDQFIQVVAQTNPKKVTLEEWYAEQFATPSIPSDQRVYKKGWSAIKSADGLTVYLMHPASDNIFTLTYNLGLKTTLNYPRLFALMVQSLEIVR